MPVLSLDQILTLGAATLALLACLLILLTAWLGRRATRNAAEQSLSQHDTVLARVADLELRLDGMKAALLEAVEHAAQPQEAPSPVAAAAPGYQIAIRLARSGASREDLVSGCGLSIHEAELVHRLHAPQPRAANSAPVARSNVA